MKTIKRTGQYLLAAIILIPTGYPLVYLVFSSFKSSGDYVKNLWGFPKTFFVENYEKVFSSRFFTYFFNSVIVAVVSLCLLVFFASLASYVLSRVKFKLRGVIFAFFIAGMMIPVHSTLIPIYSLTNKIGLYNSIWGLIGPYAAAGIPISVFIMTGFFRGVPMELEEAAFMEGCGHYRFYASILMPVAKPAVATVAIYNFVNIWNEFIYALVLINSPSAMTLPLGIREFYGKETINIPGILTVVLMGALPMILFFVLAQEKVIHSITAGAVKG
jgi:raffinose/stachyose/melibiose transport system permease protein